MHDEHLHCEHYDELFDEVVEQAVAIVEHDDLIDEHEVRMQDLEDRVDELEAMMHAMLEEEEVFEDEDEEDE